MRVIKKIRVLVVDDSIVYREMISKGISADPGIEVVATAIDPFDARDKIVSFEPDVMTLDVEMPKMDGIQFLRQLMPQYPLPVIVSSSVSAAVFDAMNAGAVDFLTKPDMKSGRDFHTYINELITKIKVAASANLSGQKAALPKIAETPKIDWGGRLVAIGASTGGTEAILAVLKALPADMPGIVIVQHMPPVFTGMYAQRLDNALPFSVKEAETGDIVKPGCVFVAPGDRQMRLTKIGGVYKIDCFAGEKVNGHCPSVDVLFNSVAEKAGANAVGVILTGMGYDGAKGMVAMRKAGGRTIGQDEKSCVVYGMPKVAFDLGGVEKQVSLGDIPQTIHAFLHDR